jgi:hypothetical protein
MRKIMLAAAVVLTCGAAHAQGLTNLQVAQATPTPDAATLPQAAAPEAATPPAAQPSKPAKKRQAAKRRETNEEKARRIAAKYGVSW